MFCFIGEVIFKNKLKCFFCEKDIFKLCLIIENYINGFNKICEILNLRYWVIWRSGNLSVVLVLDDIIYMLERVVVLIIYCDLIMRLIWFYLYFDVFFIKSML